MYKLIDYDEDGVTQISLKNLEKYKDKDLEYIIIESEFPQKTIFVFKDNTAYKASGFSTGYGGEGPHGLYKALKMFNQYKNSNFNDTSISLLDNKKTWYWYPNKGFTEGNIWIK